MLIVEDEPYLAEAIRDGLRLEAIAADIAGDGDAALELLSVNAYDIAVLDRDIPGPTGDEIAERIVASGSGMPILMLTAADRLDDKASGFELGADDYLTKPFELRELVLRLRALDRRRAHNRPPVREIAGLRLDPFRREVYRDGRYVALTRKQFAVLEVLVGAEGGVVSAEELLERAWDEHADPFTNAVRITVSALRKRLGEPWIIATVAGVGYRIDTQPGTGREGGDRGASPWSECSRQTHPQLRRLPDGRRRLDARRRVGGRAALHTRRCDRTPPSFVVVRRRPLRPSERLRLGRGIVLALPAGVRSRRRVAARRPDARSLDAHHRRHSNGRDRIALASDPAPGPQRRAPRARRQLRRDARPARSARRRTAEVRSERLPRTAHPAGDHADAARRRPQRSEPRHRRARRPPPRRQHPRDRPHRSIAPAQPGRPTVLHARTRRPVPHRGRSHRNAPRSRGRTRRHHREPRAT